MKEKGGRKMSQKRRCEGETKVEVEEKKMLGRV